MERLTFTAIALALIASLTGCQSFPAIDQLNDKKTFTAPSYYGKEIHTGFVANHHRSEESGGHEFRGYHFGPRHWYF